MLKHGGAFKFIGGIGRRDVLIEQNRFETAVDDQTKFLDLVVE
jgi:hypothetical protein